MLTLEEAHQALAQVRPLLEQASGQMGEVEEVQNLLKDMESYWGESINDATNSEHGQYLKLKGQLTTAMGSVETLVRSMVDHGAYVKSVQQGLLDFYGRRQSGELVFFCWRRDEGELAWWHPIEGGFGGRRPLDEF